MRFAISLVEIFLSAVPVLAAESGPGNPAAKVAKV